MSELSDEDFDKKLSYIRHALRNPLNSILDYAELLADDARESDNERLAKDLDSIAGSARRAADLIDTLINRDQFVEGAEEKQPQPQETSASDSLQEIDLSDLSVSEELYNRLKIASDNHSITDMRMVLDALEAEGPELVKLADHLRALNQQYDMHAIQKILDHINHA